jgi:hypothetical protein
MGAKNKVIAGDYKGKGISGGIGAPSISNLLGKNIRLTSAEVAKYELVTDEIRKSMASGAARGIIGTIALGPIVGIAGVLSAKSKGVYQVAIEFNDGKKSLLEVDKKIYQKIVKHCF